MIKIANLDNESFEVFRHNVRSGIPFAVTGLVSLLRLFLVQKTLEVSKKKVLFVTSSEQNALKYQNDLKRAFEVEAQILPFQNISMYDTVTTNKYDYSEQVKILRTKPDIVIAPIKVLLEKFPNKDFFKQNKIDVKVGDEIDTKKFAQSLVSLGIKELQWLVILQNLVCVEIL